MVVALAIRRLISYKALRKAQPRLFGFRLFHVCRYNAPPAKTAQVIIRPPGKMIRLMAVFPPDHSMAGLNVIVIRRERKKAMRHEEIEKS